LIHEDKENPLELFQVWLNLPQKNKFADPYYKMLWSEDIPIVETTDDNGNKSSIRLISGACQGVNSLEPAPNSWAHDPENQVGIRIIRMAPDAVLTLPAVSATLSRNLFFYEGETLSIQQTEIQVLHSVKLVGDEDIIITNGAVESSLLILEGEPIDEPIVKYGPFVMNTEQEIKDAYRDYQATGFGGWPWERRDPVHSTGTNRFARYKDGTEEDRGPIE
jgi:redox-sensitive bicupin YhaK (pirin superfamily)